ncbi:flagellar protein FlbD [Alkalihalophilus pseudofirmus]|uniref:Flagellar FlbD family protein n=1 Tax=Alkalihalophilus pseudofirmus TaxID=79885 RepID=A0AAJ2U120_ALKPS|nr:flagellar FlbD family protein [Alkalihalophilus pseudofirmus]MDV2885267.1 flagellar FlbD family protein [Alkalihalophilus pseudofirmus]OLS37481.1 flagellar protein FlbD [Alkalihalophilus pseudofirmus]WEG15612.1 flagellar FlbD family protein [Alkalihalophilus pseudofirmus]
MIELIRLNGQPFMLNVLLIEQIEAFPDTTITLVSGKKIVVKNDIKEVYSLINQRYKEIGLISIYKGLEGS